MKRTGSDKAVIAFEPIRDVLRRAGVSATHQRLEIYLAVAASEDHPDVEAVFRRVRETLPTVSLDTVYRALELFKNLGLVETLGPPGVRLRYDARTDAHHHFVCVKCGRTHDFKSPELDRLRVPDAVKAWGSADKIRVEVRGVCSACARGRGTLPKGNVFKKESKRRRTCDGR